MARGPLARSLRLRVTLLGSLAVLVALVVGAVLFDVLLDRSLRDAESAAAEQQADSLADQLEASGSTRLPELDDVTVQLQRDGALVATGDPEDGDAPLLPVADEAVFLDLDGDPQVVRSSDVEIGGAEYDLVVARPLEDVGDATSATAGLLVGAVPLLTLVVGVLLWLVAGRALRPVERIRAEVDAIGGDDLDSRVSAAAAGDEIGRLAATMNRMLERLAASRRSQRRFVADASHELRSPVATLRQHAQLARAHPEATDLAHLAEVVDLESLRLEELVDALLILARVDERAARAPVAVDVDDLLLSEASRLRGLGGIEVTAREIGAARVTGDVALISRAVRNGVENARRHARSTVALSVRTEGREVVVRVDDDGDGVPAGERERIFERFVRLDESRARDAGGSGLGLAIVAETAKVHGGRASLGDSPLGGARFELRLPAAPDEAASGS